MRNKHYTIIVTHVKITFSKHNKWFIISLCMCTIRYIASIYSLLPMSRNCYLDSKVPMVNWILTRSIYHLKRKRERNIVSSERIQAKEKKMYWRLQNGSYHRMIPLFHNISLNFEVFFSSLNVLFISINLNALAESECKRKETEKWR